MAWFLALQGPAHPPHQSLVYELQDAVDVDKIAQELVSSVTLDRVVPIPAVLSQNKRRHQKVTLYVRPAAWGLWGVLRAVRRRPEATLEGQPGDQRARPSAAAR